MEKALLVSDCRNSLRNEALMKNLWRIWVIVLHGLVLLVLVGLVLLKTGFISRNIDRGDHGFGEYYDTMLSFHERGDAALPSNGIILLGDSLIQGLPALAVSDHAVNYGIGADTIAGLEFRIPKYKSLSRARAIVLAIGINDMRDVDNPEIENRYMSMLKLLPEDVPYYCNAAVPLDEKINRDWHGRSNERYKDWNMRLKRVCESTGGTYLSVPDAFMSDNGLLPAEYHIGDGLHLNAAGNAVWAAHLHQLIDQSD